MCTTVSFSNHRFAESEVTTKAPQYEDTAVRLSSHNRKLHSLLVLLTWYVRTCTCTTYCTRVTPEPSSRALILWNKVGPEERGMYGQPDGQWGFESHELLTFGCIQRSASWMQCGAKRETSSITHFDFTYENTSY